MNAKPKLFEWKGIVIAAGTLAFSLAAFYGYTGQLFYSLVAGALTSSLCWGTYIVIRMCFIATRE